MNELSEKVERLQNMLVAHATDGSAENEDFRLLRDELMNNPLLKKTLPSFLRTCRNLSQFWGFIKQKFASYRERREYLWAEFAPAIESAESIPIKAHEATVSNTLLDFSASGVHGYWTKALERKEEDPEGAITAARSLLESVCKHILDDIGEKYEANNDLSDLYKILAQKLKLAPNQHTEQIFKQILTGCRSVVEGLGALRNKLGDSHGMGRVVVKPHARHAELAINLSGALAVFLIETWKDVSKKAHE